MTPWTVRGNRKSYILVNAMWWSTPWLLKAAKLTPSTHWGRDKIATILQLTFSNACSWMKNVWISIMISLQFVPFGPIDDIPTLVQIIAWRQPGDKPLSEPIMFRLLMHICVTRPHWDTSLAPGRCQCNRKLVIFTFISRIDILGISCEIALTWLAQDLTDD